MSNEKHGHWLNVALGARHNEKGELELIMTSRCSCCRKDNDQGKTDVCPNCNAIMDEVVEK